MIETDELINRGVYRLRSRNLDVGVYNSEFNYFVGIRNKFNTEFLDVEYNQQTAYPQDFIGMVDIDPVDGWWEDDPEREGKAKWVSNKPLFEYLEQYKQPRAKWLP